MIAPLRLKPFITWCVFTISFLLSVSSRAQTLMPLPAHSTVWSSSVRGYWFTAPTNFTITGLKVAAEAGTGLQYIHVMKINDAVPVVFGTTSTNFTTLTYISGATNNVTQTVSIPVVAGDIIGILGSAGTSLSYSASSPFSTTIGSFTVSLNRLLYQGNINLGQAPNYSTEASGSLGRVEMTYTTTPITCPAPTLPTATSITPTTASLNWTQTGTASQWQIKYGVPGFNPATAGTSIYTTTKPYTLNPPLSQSTSYSYYVRAICGANDTSFWSPVTNFTTTCVSPSVVSKKDSFNCGPGSVNLEASTSAGSSIKWYAALTGGTALFTGNAYTTPSLTTTTTYYIAAANGTCESSPRQPVVATIRPVPVVNLGNDTTICPGISYTFNAGNAGASFSWNTGESTQSVTKNAAGTYSVLVTLNGCGGSDAINITPGAVPVNNLPLNTDLCTGEIVNLNAGNTGSTFLWTPSAATTQTINVSAGGTNTVKITSVDGCIINSSTNVLVRPLPVNNLIDDTSICQGDQIVLDAGNPGYAYLWSNGLTTQTINATDSGTYSVLVTTPYNCINEEEVHVAFLPAPRVEGFNFIPQFYANLGQVKFTPLNPLNVTSYQWDFGDNSPLSTAINPMHIYSQAGNYQVTLKVFNGCGDFDISLPINVDLATGIVTPGNIIAEVSLYPNPSKDIITIENKSATVKMEEINVFNMLGANIYNSKIESDNKHQLSVAGLPSGMYTIRISTNKGFIVRKFEVLK